MFNFFKKKEREHSPIIIPPEQFENVVAEKKRQQETKYQQRVKSDIPILRLEVGAALRDGCDYFECKPYLFSHDALKTITKELVQKGYDAKMKYLESEWEGPWKVVIRWKNHDKCYW